MTSDAAPTGSFPAKTAAMAVGLFAGVVVLFSRSAGFGFIRYDDPLYVTENPYVLDGLSWEGARWALTALGTAGNWHPLTWLSHMTDVELFGVDAGAHHLVSVVLHALSCAVLFLALRRMIAEAPGFRDRAAGLAAFAVGVFAVHPLRIESVVWVAERKDVLAALFWSLSLLAYSFYARGPTFARYATLVGTMALGLMAKPTLVTLPLALLLLDLWPLGRIDLGHSWSRNRARALALTVEKAPLLVLSLASGIVTLVAQRAGGAVGSLAGFPLLARAGNAAASYVVYAQKLVWPGELAVFYAFPFGDLLPWKTVGASAVGLTITALTIAAARRRPWLTVGWLWYVVTLLPMAGLIQVGLQARADRYTYVPHIGLCLLAACGLSEWVETWRVPAAVYRVAGVGVIVVYAAATWAQMSPWRDGESLFRHAIRVTRGNFLAHHALAMEIEARGRPLEAIEHCREAVRLFPAYAEAHRDLGRLLADEGEHDEAVEHAETAVRLKPDDARMRVNLGWVFTSLAQDPEALAAYREAVRLEPSSFESWILLGVAMERLQDRVGAIEAYLRAAALEPARVEPHLNLGGALLRSGRAAEAAAAFRRAIAIDAGHAEARHGLALASLELGDRAAAVAQHERLRELDPARAARLGEILARKASDAGESRTAD